MNRLEYFPQCEACLYWKGECKSESIRGMHVEDLISDQKDGECLFFEPEVII